MINKIAEFKDRLNEALSIRQVSPVELSRRTKISESTISQYRSGYAKPKDKKLALISNALNVNPAWLMGLDVPMENNPKPNNAETLPICNEDGEKIGEIKIDDLINTLATANYSRLKSYYDAFNNAFKQSPYYKQIREAKNTISNNRDIQDMQVQMNQLRKRMNVIEEIYRKVGDQKWLFQEEDLSEKKWCDNKLCEENISCDKKATETIYEVGICKNYSNIKEA